MFVNLTPHVIRIKGVDLDLDTDQILEVPPSGLVAIRLTRMSEAQEHRLDRFAYVIKSRALGGVALGGGLPFPDPELGNVFLVSSMVQEALPHRGDVLAPDTGPTAIRKDGQVWAVVGLIGPG